MQLKLMIYTGILLAACKPAESESRNPQTAKTSTSSNTPNSEASGSGAGVSANFLGSCHYAGYIGNTTCEDIYNDGVAGRTAQHEKDTCQQSMNGSWQATKCDTTARVGCSCSINSNSTYKIMWMDSGTPAKTCSDVSLVWKCKLL